MSAWTIVYKFTWILIFVLGIIVLLCVFIPQYGRYRAMKEQVGIDDAEIRDQEQETRDLYRKETMWATNREFVEQVARDDGRIKTNEMILLFVDGETSNVTPGPGR